MAGDWIPFFTDTPRKSEVLRIARLTGRSRHETVGLLMEFWGLAQKETHERLLKRLTVGDVVESVGADDAFWQAVEVEGWVKFTPAGIEIPNAENWLGKGAKARLSKAKRQKKWRAGKETKPPNVDGPVGATLSPEAPTTVQDRTGDINTSPNKDSDATVGKKKKPVKTKVKPTAEDIATAKFIWDVLLKMQPGRKEPNLQKWADHVRLMRQQDGREDAQIRKLFTAANADDFWRPNILSPAKLREKFDDLALRFKVSLAADVDASDFLPPRNRNRGHHE